MKTPAIPWVYAVLTGCCMLLLLTNCGGNDPSPQELRLNELSTTWIVQEVANDGANVTNQFTGFSLTARTDKTYNTTNGGNPWPASGTFDFLNDTSVDQLRRSDGAIITINEITATSLRLSLQVNSVGGAAAGITGSFTFSLIKQ